MSEFRRRQAIKKLTTLMTRYIVAGNRDDDVAALQFAINVLDELVSVKDHVHVGNMESGDLQNLLDRNAHGNICTSSFILNVNHRTFSADEAPHAVFIAIDRSKLND